MGGQQTGKHISHFRWRTAGIFSTSLEALTIKIYKQSRQSGWFIFWCCAQCNATAQPPTLVTILRSPSSSSYPRPCRQNKTAQSLSRHAFPLPSDWLKGQPRVRPITTNEAPQATSNAPSLSGISSALIPGKKTSVFYLSCPGTAHIARLDTAGTGFKAKP